MALHVKTKHAKILATGVRRIGWWRARFWCVELLLPRRSERHQQKNPRQFGEAAGRGAFIILLSAPVPTTSLCLASKDRYPTPRLHVGLRLAFAIVIASRRGADRPKSLADIYNLPTPLPLTRPGGPKIPLRDKQLHLPPLHCSYAKPLLFELCDRRIFALELPQ